MMDVDETDVAESQEVEDQDDSGRNDFSGYPEDMTPRRNLRLFLRIRSMHSSTCKFYYPCGKPRRDIAESMALGAEELVPNTRTELDAAYDAEYEEYLDWMDQIQADEDRRREAEQQYLDAQYFWHEMQSYEDYWD